MAWHGMAWISAPVFMLTSTAKPKSSKRKRCSLRRGSCGLVKRAYVKPSHEQDMLMTCIGNRPNIQILESSVDISRRLRPVRILLQKSTDDFDHVWCSFQRQSGRLMLHNLPHEGQPGICSGMRPRRSLWRSSAHSCRLRPSG